MTDKRKHYEGAPDLKKIDIGPAIVYLSTPTRDDSVLKAFYSADTSISYNHDVFKREYLCEPTPMPSVAELEAEYDHAKQTHNFKEMRRLRHLLHMARCGEKRDKKGRLD